jgi:hypothetical protein
MRMVVKPHQAFFSPARTDHASGLVPLSRRLPALLPSILWPPPSPHLRLGEGGGQRMLLLFTTLGALCRAARRQHLRSAGVRLGPGARPEQPSIRGGPATAPSTYYRIRLERPARLRQEPTQRTNGAFAASPGGTTAALSDLTGATPTAATTSVPSGGFAPVLDPFLSPYPSAAAACAWRRAVELTRSRQSFSWAPSGSSPCSA